jgi:hypothetical protein
MRFGDVEGGCKIYEVLISRERRDITWTLQFERDVESGGDESQFFFLSVIMF